MATKLDLYRPNLKKRPYFLSILLGLDQFVNVLFGGYVDETISSRAHREGIVWLEKLIDSMFFWDKQITPAGTIRHCELAYYGELIREHMPR